MTAQAPGRPTATYRIQLNRQFTFHDAEALVPYLSALGISHLYTSPYLKARAGSWHGYDITDYNAINPELGDLESLKALGRALRDHSMGHILDFVPNHMGIGRADNGWWLDVLEWGPASPHAAYFDIDWAPSKPDLRGKVLLPFLGDHYGRVLERGELKLAFDAEQGSFGVWYHEHLFPIAPPHFARILMPRIAQLRAQGAHEGLALDAIEELAMRARALRLSAPSTPRRARLREIGLELKRDLAAFAAAEPKTRAAVVEAAVEQINGTPGEPRSFTGLHRLLERQAYRLAYWRVAADEINYRRFFDINDLAGVRMERAELFEIAHRLVSRLIGEGVIDGLRIDHVDGLYDPIQYCRRLHARAAELRLGRGAAGAGPAAPDEAAAAPFFVVVEKILARHEQLRREWPVAGTTGYESLNLINGLFVNPKAEKPLDRIYRSFIGSTPEFDEIVYECKKHVMDNMLSSELQVLANELDRISESSWLTRDFTLAGIRTALREVVACFPVYRTYVNERGASGEDRRDIEWAVSLARRRSHVAEATLFDFIQKVLTTDLVRGRRPAYSRRAAIRFAMRFQQFTGPVTAKALEDTSFYRFNRLLSLNEVGGDPRRFGISLSAFHHLNQESAQHWPQSLVATATHDTKRGEDARCRINVLSDLPEEWGRRVRRWTALNRRAKTEVDGVRLPGRNDQYLLYQTLVGSWPMELLDGPLDEARLTDFRARVETCLIKAVREAKLQSSWIEPNPAYENALTTFLLRILDPVRSAAFLDDFLAFEARIAFFGMLNGLSQVVLKLTLPGVPDVYQGAELWDLNMVDPDNRRPVDFAPRQALIRDLHGDSRLDPRALLETWRDGRIKLFLLARLLKLRRDHPRLALEGAYVPLTVEGVHADRLCAFARVKDDEALLVLAPRFFAGLSEGDTRWPLGELWRDTAVLFPEELSGKAYRDVLTGAALARRPPANGRVLASEALAVLPVAVLFGETAPRA